MFSKYLTTLTTASIAALTLATNTQAAELTTLAVLDPFDVSQLSRNEDNQFVVETTTEIIAPFETSFFSVPLERTISGTIVVNPAVDPPLPPPPAASVQADSNRSQLGSFSVANGSGRESRITVSYDSPIEDPMGGGFNIIDFTAGGVADRLIINVTDNDSPMDLTFNFIDFFGGMGEISVETPGDITSSNPTTLTVLFSELPILEFGAITQFSFDVETQSEFPAADITFESFSVGAEITPTTTTTPEPGTILGLMAVSGLGLVSRRRQTKTSKQQITE